MRYDTTLKTLFQSPPPQLLQLLVGGQAREMLTVEYPTVQMRRSDLVVRLTDGRLYHLELQSTNDPAMPWRMLEYFSLLCQAYGQPPYQQVLYVGDAALSMAVRLAYPTLSFQYEMIDIRTLDGETLLASAALADNLLALLCRLANPREAIQRLLARIAGVAGAARDDAIAQLLALAGLRRLHPLVLEETKHMPIMINIRENPFFREVFEEGKQEGRQKEAVALLCRQLEHRFGALSASARQQIEAADTPTLEAWSLRLLDATSLEEVLRIP